MSSSRRAGTSVGALRAAVLRRLVAALLGLVGLADVPGGSALDTEDLTPYGPASAAKVIARRIGEGAHM